MGFNVKILILYLGLFDLFRFMLLEKKNNCLVISYYLRTCLPDNITESTEKQLYKMLNTDQFSLNFIYLLLK